MQVAVKLYRRTYFLECLLSFHILCFPTQRETSFHFHSHLELYIIEEQPFAILGMNIFAHLEVIDSVVSHSVAH